MNISIKHLAVVFYYLLVSLLGSCGPRNNIPELAKQDNELVTASLNDIKSASALTTNVTRPGETSALLKAFLTVKNSGKKGDVVTMIQTSDNPVAIAYCLLYLVETDEPLCRKYLFRLNRGFRVQNYGMLQDMPKEAFLEILFDSDRRKIFTEEAQNRSD